jgi:hypothetical protein
MVVVLLSSLGIAAMPSTVSAQVSLDFYQMDFRFDGTTYYNNTEWGKVDFTFVGQVPIMYFNLAVNGSWQIQNIPVLSDNGVGVIQTMTYYFNLGTERGTVVTSLNYDYAFTSDILGTMPGGSNPASVGHDYIALWSGTQGALMPELTAAEPLVGGEVSSQKHTHKNFPNQDCGPNECCPAAISNSLKFLNKENSLGLTDAETSIAAMKDATGWSQGTHEYWYYNKIQYMQLHNYPISTRYITDIGALATEIDNGQDVEIMESGYYWDETTKTWNATTHVMCLVGIEHLKNGNYSLDVADDMKQGIDGEGCEVRTRIYNSATNELSGGGEGGVMGFSYAAVECPEIVRPVPPIVPISIPIDDTYKAPIRIMTVHNVSSYKIGLRFDPHILECLSVTEGPYLSDVGTTTWTPGTIDNVDGTVTSHTCTLEAGKSQSGTGELAYVTFRVKNYGTTVIDLTDTDGDPCECMVLNPHGMEISLAFLDGEVTFREPSVGGIHCFIATAAYGTPMAEEIQILREFRDEYLLTNSLGRAFVDFYYMVSPPIAEFITEHPSLKPMVRAGLVPAVAMSTVAVNTTPAKKIAIIGLVVLVSVAVAIRSTRRRGRGPEYT